MKVFFLLLICLATLAHSQDESLPPDFVFNRFSRFLAKECHDNTQCSENQVCDHGKCIGMDRFSRFFQQGCVKNDQCSEDQVCDHGNCIGINQKKSFFPW
ncbi:DUF7107 domain-containing protein [Caenorhabditis elegans]|uniref:DUF7107 domain-containing protein n=1 Tax=Caenorhabditis elegans TaxID=6239 RepID=U4PCG5_CAEEL|nr:EB domain-containing protein [Caenorhabditis elegans]CDH93424.1 EB domain-containing protein [Caenorhabditis elegans]|eukprot:NP_001294619.1 Uncharacterized protein CELE_B0513.90 [Caenorhabditis elegans]